MSIRRRCWMIAAPLALALAANAMAAINYLDQITGGTTTGMYQSQISTLGNVSCDDDFEIEGVAGVGPQSGIVLMGVQAVFAKTGPGPFAPSGGFRVNIFSNDGDPSREFVRTHPLGDVFTRDFTPAQSMVSPVQIPGPNGNFADAFVVTFDLGSIMVPLGSYYLSVQAITGSDTSSQYFVLGSDHVTIGTPNDLFRVFNPGAGGTVSPLLPDNAAYRVIGVPGPGGAALVSVGVLAMLRRRRR